jgi:ribosomal protein L16/L10AE
MLEISGLDKETSEKILTSAAKKLPIKARVVAK